MTTTSFPPRLCACGCGKVFTPKVYNEAHASVSCARRAAQRRRTLRAQAEREAEVKIVPTPEGWHRDPTVDVLNAQEALLLAQGEGGKTFCGNVPVWQPTDGRVMWTEAGGGEGAWNMVWAD